MSTVDGAEVEAAAEVARRIEANIARAVQVRDEVMHNVLVTLLAEGSRSTC